MPAFVLGLAALAAIAVSCRGEASTPHTPTPAPTRAAPTAEPSPDWKEPLLLPVDLAQIDYRVVDPAFEPLPGARALYGTYQGGGYQVEVPANWNGELVYYAHGFVGNPPELIVHPPPIREYLIESGFAWAASSYTRNGYEPGAGARDTQALRAVVERELGRVPARSYLYGVSMGGHVVTLSLEQYPTAYDGGFSECGAVSGNEILDYFLSWGTLSSHLAGVPLYDAALSAGEFGTRLIESVAPALGLPDEPTAAGRVFESAIEHLSGGPRPFLAEGFGQSYVFNYVILVNAVGAASNANYAAQNADTEYHLDPGLILSEDDLNREVPRIAADPDVRNAQRFPEFGALSGAIERPLITIHGTGDLFVPIALEQSYRRTVDAAGAGDLLVQRAVRRPGHCNFTDAERIRGFEDLVRWVRDDVKPPGDNLLGSLVDVGRQWTVPLEPDDPGTTTFRN
jgi:hypothetical protein